MSTTTRGREAEAEAARDEAIAQVALRPAYVDALPIAVSFAKHTEHFTSEDLRDEIIRLDPELAARIKVEGRVLGPIMTKLGKLGVAYPSNQTRKSGRRTNHNRPQTVWRGGRRASGV